MEMLAQLVVVWAMAAVASGEVQVDLDQGVATGRVDATPLGDVTKFLGLPYAEAPIGKLRFRPPLSHLGWGPARYDATYFRPACIQKREALGSYFGMTSNDVDKMKFSEDCLYLNVFVPGNGLNETGRLPVMVWFHGGDFRSGSGEIVGTTSKASPEALVLSGDVIVVTFNYRLGVFGFLSLGGDSIAGNSGIQDQVKALEWVKNNIAKFGGDPETITLFGDEVGGLSVQLQLFMEHTYGWYKRVAISSGAYTGWGVPTAMHASHHWTHFAESGGCRTMNHNMTEVLECLQVASADLLLDKTPKMSPMLIVDDHVLKDQPANLLKEGKFNPVEMIVGFNAFDGDYFLFGKSYARDVYTRGIPEQKIEMMTNKLSKLGYPQTNTKIGRNIQRYVSGIYFQNSSDPIQNFLDAVHLFKDGMFLSPAIELAHFNTLSGKPAFLYVFEKDSAESVARHQGSPLNGTAFGAEVRYIMGDVNASPGGERDFTESVMEAWSSFAASGKPTFTDNKKNVKKWPQFDGKMTRLCWSEPLADGNIVRTAPKGSVFFGDVFTRVLKAMKMEDKEKMNGECGSSKMCMNGKGMKEMGMHEKCMQGMEKPEGEEQEEEESKEEKPAMLRPQTERPKGEVEAKRRNERVNGGPEEGESEKGKAGKLEHGLADRLNNQQSGHSDKLSEIQVFTYIMLGFICLLVILMVIVFALICGIYSQMRQAPKSEKFG